MKFQPGQSGNPAGRPRGSRNRRTIAADRLFRERPSAFELPRMATAGGAVGIMASIVQRVADGDLTPREAAKLAKVVQAFAQTLTTTERDRQSGEPVKDQT
jgi:hypothetical protein